MMMSFVALPQDLGLKASDSTVATWKLKRERDWANVKVILQGAGVLHKPLSGSLKKSELVIVLDFHVHPLADPLLVLKQVALSG
jgi:hypothetical protein